MALETLDNENLKPLMGVGWTLSPRNRKGGLDFTKSKKGKFFVIPLTRKRG